MLMINNNSIQNLTLRKVYVYYFKLALIKICNLCFFHKIPLKDNYSLTIFRTVWLPSFAINLNI